jgi:hypothetical protein
MTVRHTLAALALAAAPVLACSSGGDSDNTPAAPAGPQNPPLAQLWLHDAAPDGVSSVKFRVAAVQLHIDAAGDSTTTADDASIDNDGKWKSLPVDLDLDLVQLPGIGSSQVLGNLNLPEGKVTQIRLLIDPAAPHTYVMSGVEKELPLDRVPPTGIKIVGTAHAPSAHLNGKLDLYLDLDLAKSLFAQGEGAYVFEPKLKLDLVKDNGVEQAL